MRYLVIHNYVEKVTTENLGTERNPWFKVDKGNFELKSTVYYPNEPRTARQLIKDGKRRRFFHSYIRNGYRTNCTSSYGLKSYQEVSVENL